jgi:hypothetical protein
MEGLDIEEKKVILSRAMVARYLLKQFLKPGIEFSNSFVFQFLDFVKFVSTMCLDLL